jgi:hypothetical protein
VVIFSFLRRYNAAVGRMEIFQVLNVTFVWEGENGVGGFEAGERFLF